MRVPRWGKCPQPLPWCGGVQDTVSRRGISDWPGARGRTRARVYFIMGHVIRRKLPSVSGSCTLPRLDLAGHMNFSRAEVGGVKGRGKKYTFPSALHPAHFPRPLPRVKNSARGTILGPSLESKPSLSSAQETGKWFSGTQRRRAWSQAILGPRCIRPQASSSGSLLPPEVNWAKAREPEARARGRGLEVEGGPS